MENAEIRDRFAQPGNFAHLPTFPYQSIVEVQPDLICRFLPDSTLTFVNEAYCRFFGETRQQLIGTRFLDDLPAGARREIREHIAAVIKTRVAGTREHDLVRSDGKIVSHQWVNQPIYDSNGAVVELQGIGHDITAQKRIEEALKLSQSNFQDMADALPILVYLLGPDGKLTFGNKALLNFHSLKLSDLVSVDLIAWVHPEYREIIRQQFAEAIKSREPFSFEFPMRWRDDQNYRWFYKVAVPRFAPDLTFLGWVGSCTDVHDLKTSHEALRTSEERYRNVVETQSELICRYLLDGTLTFVNDAYCKFFGKSSEELLGRSLFTLLPEDERQRTKEFINSLVNEPRCEPITHKVTLADGSIGWQEWVDHTIIDSEGRFVEMQGVGRDITLQKRTEAALRSSEERFKAFMGNIPAAAWITDIDTRIIYANETFKRSFGDRFTSVVGRTVFDLFPAEKAQVLALNTRYVATTGEPMEIYDEFIQPDGSVGSTLVYKFSLDYDEQGSRRIGGLAMDITAQKQAERKIKESEELFRTLLGDLHIGVVVYDGDATVLLANQAALDMFGLTGDEVIGKPVFDDEWTTLGEDGSLVPPHERPAIRAIKTGTPVRGAVMSMFRPTMKGPRWCQIDAIPILDDAGRLKHVVSTFSDITAMKEANENLKASRNEYRRIVTTAYEGVWTLDLKGKTIFVNDRFAEMLGYTVDEMKERPATDLIEPDANLKTVLGPKWQLTETRCQFDARFRHKNGSKIWGLVSAAALYEVTGEIAGSLLMVTDITSRKAAEDQVHGMAARILNLQDDERRRIALALHDDTAQELSVLNINLSALKKRFSDGSFESKEINKGQMLLGKALKEVRTLSYLLHPPMLEDAGLISAVYWFAEGFSKRSDIVVSLKLDESIGRLPNDIENALYRVVQEALTNVHRHSFAKTAAVIFDRNGDTIRLRIVDRGRGMPGESGREGLSDFTSLGVGIMGMKQRLNQIGGTLTIESGDRGTTVTATVPAGGIRS